MCKEKGIAQQREGVRLMRMKLCIRKQEDVVTRWSTNEAANPWFSARVISRVRKLWPALAEGPPYHFDVIVIIIVVVALACSL